MTLQRLASSTVPRTLICTPAISSSMTPLRGAGFGAVLLGTTGVVTVTISACGTTSTGNYTVDAARWPAARRCSLRHLNNMFALMPPFMAIADPDAPGSRLCRTSSSLNARSCCRRVRFSGSRSLFMVCTISAKRTPPSGCARRVRCFPSSARQARTAIVGLLRIYCGCPYIHQAHRIFEGNRLSLQPACRATRSTSGQGRYSSSDLVRTISSSLTSSKRKSWDERSNRNRNRKHCHH